MGFVCIIEAGGGNGSLERGVTVLFLFGFRLTLLILFLFFCHKTTNAIIVMP